MSLIVTLPLNNVQKVNIYQGTHGKYYCIQKMEHDDLFPIYYDIHFPLHWALNEKKYYYLNDKYITGPLHCTNCKDYGFYNGVFIGYCLNCAKELEYTRGNGMIDEEGVEFDETMVNFDLNDYNRENSMWNTYLKDVDLREMGDVQLKEEYEMYKDLPDLIDDEYNDESVIVDENKNNCIIC
jgi:hypothetical protein